MRWTLLVPIRAQSNPKSRLAATLRGRQRMLHADLVEAMRTDVLTAARGTIQVARIVVVADGEHGHDVDLTIRQHRPGLNGALLDGAEYATGQWPSDGIAALVGDLPCLQSAELAAALDEAARHVSAYVADAAGTGTTLLTTAPGHQLRPAFGLGSAARHARTAVALTDVGPGLRRDVDTLDDLMLAAQLGTGPATARVWGVMPRSR